VSLRHRRAKWFRYSFVSELFCCCIECLRSAALQGKSSGVTNQWFLTQSHDRKIPSHASLGFKPRLLGLLLTRRLWRIRLLEKTLDGAQIKPVRRPSWRANLEPLPHGEERVVVPRLVAAPAEFMVRYNWDVGWKIEYRYSRALPICVCFCAFQLMELVFYNDYLSDLVEQPLEYRKSVTTTVSVYRLAHLIVTHRCKRKLRLVE